MLPVVRRVRRPAEFASVVRDGRRAGGSGLVVHVRSGEPSQPARAGFIVSKAVGTAVVRNRVRRRLRHLIEPTLRELPDGLDLVLRVQPAAAAMSRAELATTLETTLNRALRAARA